MKTFNDIIYSFQGKDFKYGEQDCFLFIIDVIEQLGGKVNLSTLKGAYNNLEEALLLLKSLGYEDYLNAVDEIIITDRKLATEANHKDLVFIQLKDSPFGGALGICHGKRAYFLTEKGICAFTLKKCKYAWSLEQFFEEDK